MIKLYRNEVIAYSVGSMVSLTLALALPALFAVVGVTSLIGCVVYAWLYPSKVEEAVAKHVGQGARPEASKGREDRK